MIRGGPTTTLHKFGRFRIPAKFRKAIEENYGKEVFITSFDLKHILIYPLAEWDKKFLILVGSEFLILKSLLDKLKLCLTFLKSLQSSISV